MKSLADRINDELREMFRHKPTIRDVLLQECEQFMASTEHAIFSWLSRVIGTSGTAEELLSALKEAGMEVAWLTPADGSFFMQDGMPVRTIGVIQVDRKGNPIEGLYPVASATFTYRALSDGSVEITLTPDTPKYYDNEVN